ncbi:endonuclease/exonuclease/phosphatase family protein [Endothiovibrio diazotrophicus]
MIDSASLRPSTRPGVSLVTQHQGAPAARMGAGRRLKLLSFNVQVGIATSRYRHYLLHSWKHLLPDPERSENLDRIARCIGDYDIVGLQEVDAGSFRSDFTNQTEYLAHHARFPHWSFRTNRNLGKLAQHSLGLLSRIRPSEVVEHRLPGVIPGRGALMARFGRGEESLVVYVLHLALGSRARMIQLDYIAERIDDERHAVVMGDLNCRSDSREIERLLARSRLCEPQPDLHTFPSWRPRHNIDHILITPQLHAEAPMVIPCTISDHLPIAMEVELPAGLVLEEGEGG